MLYSLTRPSQESLTALLASQLGAELSYPDVGATKTGDFPDGYHHAVWTRPAGNGPDAFAAAKARIDDWAGHRRAGATVVPAGAPIEVGTEVAIGLKAVSVWVTACCRIVWTVDEPDVYGFAYGTLPHHPESGEESFVARMDEAGDVIIEITAFSRGNSVLTRAAGPIGRRIQARTVGRYLDGLTGT